MSPRRVGVALALALAVAGCRAAQPDPAVTPIAAAAATPQGTPARRPTLATGLVPTPLPVPAGLQQAAAGMVPGKVVPTRLVIPRIGLDSSVVEVGIRLQGGSPVWETASHAVGYHQGTGLLGQAGNVVLSGHISSQFHGNVFHRLPELGLGDTLVVMAAGQRSYLYRVVSREVVLPSAVEVMETTSEEVVTLITCVPDGLYTHRLIVKAQRV